jgi:hypothetical protein
MSSPFVPAKTSRVIPAKASPVIPAKAGIQLFPFTLAVLTLLSAPTHAQSRWATYTNDRYAFAVDYPRDIFTGYAEPDNSDGATFKTDAPWVEMRAWGSYNVEKKTPRACFAERYAGKNQNTTLDYSSVKRDAFVVSGIERGAVGRARLGQFECDHHGARTRLFARNTKEIGRLRRKASCALRRRCRKQAVLPDGTE